MQLTEYFKNKGVTQKDIADKLGVSKAYINSLFTGKRPFGKKQADIWEKEFGISKSWLLTGDGQMLVNHSDSSHVAPVASYNKDKRTRVRFVDINPCATFTEFTAVTPAEYEYVDIIPDPDDDITDDDIIFKIYGDSMEPMIPNHSKVLSSYIRPSQWHWARGVVVIAYDNFFVIKRIAENHLDQENYLLLESDNPIYPQKVKVPLSSIHSIFRAIRVVSSPIH